MYQHVLMLLNGPCPGMWGWEPSLGDLQVGQEGMEKLAGPFQEGRCSRHRLLPTRLPPQHDLQDPVCGPDGPPVPPLRAARPARPLTGGVPTAA